MDTAALDPDAACDKGVGPASIQVVQQLTK
jgi:hypothetical protein